MLNLSKLITYLKSNSSIDPSGYFQKALLFKDSIEDFFHLITPIMQFEVDKQVKIHSYYHKEFVDVELKNK